MKKPNLKYDLPSYSEKFLESLNPRMQALRSSLGYSDYSPFKNEPFIDIKTPTGMIDMSNTGTPLFANGRFLPPYSGLHNMGTTNVREIPARNIENFTVKFPLKKHLDKKFRLSGNVNPSINFNSPYLLDLYGRLRGEYNLNKNVNIFGEATTSTTDGVSINPATIKGGFNINFQEGGSPFQAAERQGVRNNPDGSHSTHLMRTETIDGINWISFPTLFENSDGTWLDLSQEENWKIPMMEARKRGEVVHFGQDKEAALRFGEGSWKPEEQSTMERGKTLPMAQRGIEPYVAVQDKTYVHIPPPPLAPTKVIDPFPQGSIGPASPEPAWYKKLLNVVAHPMEAFGRSIHNQDWWTGDLGQGLPMSPQHSTNTLDGFDMVNTFFNPASWVEDISDSESLGEGAINTAMILPIFKGGKLVKHADEVVDASKQITKGSGKVKIEDPNALYRVVDVPVGTSADEIVKAAEYGTTIPKVATTGRRTGYSKIQRETPFDVLNTTSNQGWILGRGPNDPYNLMNLYGGKNPYVIKMGRGNPLVGPESLKTINQRTDILRNFSFPYTQNVGKWNPAIGQFDLPLELGAGVYTTVGKSVDDLAKIMPGSIVNPNMVSRGSNNITTIFGPKGFQVRQPQEVLPISEYIKRIGNNPNFKFNLGGSLPEVQKGNGEGWVDREYKIGSYHQIRNQEIEDILIGIPGVKDAWMDMSLEERNNLLNTINRTDLDVKQILADIPVGEDGKKDFGFWDGVDIAKNIETSHLKPLRKALDMNKREFNTAVKDSVVNFIQNKNPKIDPDTISSEANFYHGLSIPVIPFIDFQKGGEQVRELPKAQEGPGTDNERLDAHSVHPVSSQSNWKDLLSYNINPLNWPNIFKHSITRPTEIAFQGGINEWLAANVRPGEYPNIPQLIGEFEGGRHYIRSIKDRDEYIMGQVDSEPWTDKQGDLTIDEEAWRMFLGLPGQPGDKPNKYIFKSDNVPSIGTKEGEVFYTTDLFDWDKAINKFNNLRNEYGTEDFDFSDVENFNPAQRAKDLQNEFWKKKEEYEKSMEDSDEEVDFYSTEESKKLNEQIANLHSIQGYHKVLDKSGQPIPNTYSFVGGGHDYITDRGFKEGKTLDPFANLTMSLGEDDKGRFISYYDKYDFDSPITRNFGTPINFYDKRYIKQNVDGQWIIDPDQPKKQDGGGVDFNSLQKGIKWVESLNGELMKNTQSSASGYYGQLFDDIEYDGTRDEFIADTDFQDELFRKRAHGEIEGVPGLISNGIELAEEYKDVDHGLTPLEIAGLSNMLGRQGTREYLGYVVREGRTLDSVFPHLYGDDVNQANKTPEEYIQKFNEGLTKREGGEFLNKIRRLNQQLKIYNSGGRISPLAKKELIDLEMIKPKMQGGGSVQQNSYVTKRGDNLSRIARNNNMTLSELLEFNPRYLNNPSAIGVGDVIQLSDAPVQNNSTPNMVYEVKSGDSLSKIASQYGIRYQDIAALNNINDPTKIMPGQVIRLPDNAVVGGSNVAQQQHRAHSVYIPSQSNVIVNSNTGTNEVWAKREQDSDGNWKTTGKRALINEINKDTQANRIVRGMNDVAQSETINYTIQSGDMLGKIARQNGVSVQKLMEDNNITDPRRIQPGQQLTINKSTGKPYIIVDEKAGRMHVYYPGNSDPVKSYPIVSGLNEGDAQTKTVIHFFKDGKKLEQEELQPLMDKHGFDEVGQIASLPGYSSKTMWDLGNKSTGAGVYTIDAVNETTGFMENASSFVLANQAGDRPGTVIHATPHAGMTDRLRALDEGMSGDEARALGIGTNGCINGTCSAMTELFENPDIGNGTQVFVLPEWEGDNFVYENGQINFYTRQSNDERSMTYETKNGQVMVNPQGLNETPGNKQGNYKPINITFDKEYYQTNSERYDGSADNENAEFEKHTQPFLQALTGNKKTMMDKFGMDGDTYNDLSMIAFGIYAYESGMGDINSSLENATKFAAKAGGMGQTNPDVVSKYNTYGLRDQDNSIGFTQIQWQWLDEEEKEMLGKLDIDESNYAEHLMDPAKSADVTMAILYNRHKNNQSAVNIRNDKAREEAIANGEEFKDSDKEVYDPFLYLPKTWNTADGYTDMVNKYTDYITVTETDIDDVDNSVIVKGEYSDDNEAYLTREKDKREENYSGPNANWKTRATQFIEDVGGSADGYTAGEGLVGDVLDKAMDYAGGKDVTFSNIMGDISDVGGKVVDRTIDTVKTTYTDLKDAAGEKVTDARDAIVDFFTWKLGGEFGIRNQVQFYDDYISGLYKGTRQENSANKLYDKLNRMYYNDSKKSGKSQIDVMRSILHGNR